MDRSIDRSIDVCVCVCPLLSGDEEAEKGAEKVVWH